LAGTPTRMEFLFLQKTHLLETLLPDFFSEVMTKNRHPVR
jgi:hypothetical protein